MLNNGASQQLRQTLLVRLDTSQEQLKMLLDTMEAFNEACNFIASTAYRLRTANKMRLQKEVYHAVRDKFHLSAQMAIRAIAKVCEAYKRDRSKKPTFKPHGAMVYDQRILSWKRLEQASILTLKGRIRVPIRIGEYQRVRMDRIRGQADLTLRNRKFYLAVVVDAPEASPYDPVSALGVDLGIVNLAVDSDGTAYKGQDVDNVMHRMDRIKAKLQACGSKSAKRHLRRISGREARHRRNVNHIISKKLVAKAQDTGRAIVLENLKGIRGQTTVQKAQRRRHNSWSYYQLRSFIDYKAKLAGVPVLYVPPRGTSHTCPRCGLQAKRNRPTRSRFKCVACGLAGPADYIAALNIAARGQVSSPIVPRDFLEPQTLLRDKPTISIVGS
jgi:IS605 OrfB family transposase